MKSTILAREENGHGERKLALFAALAGVIVFTLFLDPSIVNPLRVGWLASGDPAQSYLGWLFFRHEPWTFPLGVIHSMGLEQASSIVYSDSIPLFAIAFKLISPWLPAKFQYHGLWLCACYALQGYFSCRLLALFTSRRSALTVGVLLFLLSPIMLFRAQPHLALTAHWILVASIYLYYVSFEKKRLWQWVLLLWLSPMVHAYLMFMAYAVWAAYLIRHALLDRNLSISKLALWSILAAAGSLSLMWFAGYFLNTDVSSGGFGYYSMNLLAPFLPVGAGPFMLHSPMAATTGQYEGFNYLGLGVSAGLLLAALWSFAGLRRIHVGVLERWRERTEIPLIFSCIVLFGLAVSNEVTFGSHVLFTVPVPSKITPVLNVFRASGRLFWPVYYLLLLATIRGALHLSKPLCTRWLVVVLVLQLVDMFPYLRSVSASSAAMAAQSRFPVFPSSFWSSARSRYANLYVIPGQYKDGENIIYESLAAAHGFAIDTAYYARLPNASLQEPRERRHELFFEGVLDPHGLYLIQSPALDRLTYAQRLFPSTTGVGLVDGFTVVAPDWFNSASGDLLHRPKHHNFPEMALGKIYRFGKGGDGQPYLLAGWSEPGDGATWSEGPSAMLTLHIAPVVGALKLAINIEPYLPATYPTLGVNVRVNGQLQGRWEFERGKPGPDTTLILPEALRKAGGNVAVSFSFDQARSPFQSGESVDARKLAVLLHDMSIQQN